MVVIMLIQALQRRPAKPVLKAGTHTPDLLTALIHR